jgi:hypothetical protein
LRFEIPRRWLQNKRGWHFLLRSAAAESKRVSAPLASAAAAESQRVSAPLAAERCELSWDQTF